MDLLIKHGTWIIVPLGLLVTFVYLHVYPKVYPFWLARRLREEDDRQGSAFPEPETTAADGGVVRIWIGSVTAAASTD